MKKNDFLNYAKQCTTIDSTRQFMFPLHPWLLLEEYFADVDAPLLDSSVVLPAQRGTDVSREGHGESNDHILSHKPDFIA